MSSKDEKAKALVSRTGWVRGRISVMGLSQPGSCSIGKTTPPKKNIGEINPEK